MPQKVIIIGATSGIGREMALQYLSKGCTVGITGRRLSLLKELQEAYPEQVFMACFDVQAEKRLDFLSNLVNEMQGMDLLIYNAGFGDASNTLNLKSELHTTKTNVVGCVQLAGFAFNYFSRKGFGQIALISSIAALRGNSWAPAYSASKAFISTYAEGLNIKAARMHKNIVVTDVKPGFLATKSAKENKTFWVTHPQKAALQIINAIEKKKRRVYISRRWWLVAQLLKVIPYALYKRLG